MHTPGLKGLIVYTLEVNLFSIKRIIFVYIMRASTVRFEVDYIMICRNPIYFYQKFVHKCASSSSYIHALQLWDNLVGTDHFCEILQIGIYLVHPEYTGNVFIRRIFSTQRVKWANVTRKDCHLNFGNNFFHSKI